MLGYFYVFGEDCDFIVYDTCDEQRGPSACVWMVPGTWDE